MAAPSPALQQCFDEVADSAPMALQRCLTHVVAVLKEAERTSERAAESNELGDAWRELLRHEADWCKRYPDELRSAFRSDGRATPAASHDGDAGWEGLTLVEDARIVQAIESSRLLQQVMPLVERPVSELDALVSSAMGLPGVRADLNPIRPEVFAQSLRTLVEGAAVTASTSSLWMKHMAQPLGQELQGLYGRLVVQLQDANVQAAEYRLRPTPPGKAPARPAATGAAAAPAHAGRVPSGHAPLSVNTTPQNTSPQHRTPQHATLTSRQISHALLREFLANGCGDQAAQALPPSHYMEVERELERLQADLQGRRDVAPPDAPGEDFRALPPVDRPARAVGIQSTLDRRAWGDYAQPQERTLVRTRLRKDAKRVAQVLGLELVRKVVDQVAQDPRLLAPVREAIVALEPALLRLAMVDPRFFSDEHHPGRRLMERVAQRSFKYNDEFGAEFAGFFEGVNHCFRHLNQTTVTDARPFKEAQVVLESAWAVQDDLEARARAQAVEALRFAERRQAEADQIAWELGSRPDFAGVPAVVQDFVFGPWALVLAHARLVDGGAQDDPRGYREVIADLLWSVKPEVTLRQPAQLFERVPGLLGKLKEGLALLGRSEEDSEPFFQDLMKLHRPALKLRRAKSRRDARESGMTPLVALDAAQPAQPDAAPPARKPVEGQPWMSREELGAAGFQEAQAAASPSPLGDLQLREGDWVDLHSQGSWLRAQLIWASSKATLFMFVSHGGQPHSMTRRSCERLIRDGFLRPVRMDGVVAHALDAIEHEPQA